MNERLEKCELCEFSAVHKGILNSHIKRKHNKENKEQYKCSIEGCDYSALTKRTFQLPGPELDKMKKSIGFTSVIGLGW